MMKDSLGGFSGSREPNPQAVSALSGFDPGRKRTSENNFGCDDPNDPITRAQIESIPGYFGEWQ